MRLTLVVNDIEDTFKEALEIRDEIDSLVISGLTKDGRPFVFSNSSTLQEKCTVAQFLSAWAGRRFFTGEDDERESEAGTDTVY